MDVVDAFRLRQAKRELQAQRAAFQANQDLEHANALRNTLIGVINELRQLHADEPVWQNAKTLVENAAAAELNGNFARLRDTFAETLPPLLELFGFPAPPPARQVVGESLALVRHVAGGAASEDEVDRARDELGRLITRIDRMPAQDPWQLALQATETNDAVEMAITVASGSLGGMVAGAATGVALGALTGGAGVIPGALISLGVRRWRQVREIRSKTEHLKTAQDQLGLNLFPAAAAALSEHLDAVLHPVHDELADLKTRAHLQELVDLSFRFALAYEALIPKVRRERLYRQDARPEQLLELFVAVYKVGSNAQKAFENCGAIDPPHAATLNDLLQSLRPFVG